MSLAICYKRLRLYIEDSHFCLSFFRRLSLFSAVKDMWNDILAIWGNKKEHLVHAICLQILLLLLEWSFNCLWKKCISINVRTQLMSGGGSRYMSNRISCCSDAGAIDVTIVEIPCPGSTPRSWLQRLAWLACFITKPPSHSSSSRDWCAVGFPWGRSLCSVAL